MKHCVNIHFIFVMLAAAMWGTAGIFVRTLQAFGISQITTVFGRTVFAAVILGLIILIKDRSLFKVNAKALLLLLSAGLFSILLFNFSYYMTMSLTSLSVAAVLLYTAPFFVVIISVPLFGSRLNGNKSIALVLAFLGCCMVSGLFDSSHRISGSALFFGLLTGFGYSLYTIFGELLLRQGCKTLTITFYVFLFAAICCLPFIRPAEITAITSSGALTLFLMAVINTVIPYLLYTAGLKKIEPTVAPIIATLEPVVATVIGFAVYGEKITLFGGIGIAVVLLSVVLLNRRTVTVRANAKLNLTLGILGKREDGYHLIDTIMQSVSLSDSVKVSVADKISVCYSNKEIDLNENMAVNAARLFFEETGLCGGAKIKIKNRIPTSSGMGGGSADAAAVLTALNRLYSASLSDERLEEIGLKLGADVPFFIRGGTQRAEGIGERLTVLPTLSRGWFVLAKMGKKPSTAEMYRRLDSEKPPLPDTVAAIAAITENSPEGLSKLLVNSFAAVWRDSKAEAMLEDLCPDGASLSGSGPTRFCIFTDRKKAKRAYRLLKKQGVEAYFARPAANGTLIR